MFLPSRLVRWRAVRARDDAPGERPCVTHSLTDRPSLPSSQPAPRPRLLARPPSQHEARPWCLLACPSIAFARKIERRERECEREGRPLGGGGGAIARWVHEKRPERQIEREARQGNDVGSAKNWEVSWHFFARQGTHTEEEGGGEGEMETRKREEGKKNERKTRRRRARQSHMRPCMRGDDEWKPLFSSLNSAYNRRALSTSSRPFRHP